MEALYVLAFIALVAGFKTGYLYIGSDVRKYRKAVFGIYAGRKK